MRDRRLQGVETVVQREQRMPAEVNADRLFLDRQHRRSGRLRSRLVIDKRSAMAHLATVFGLIPWRLARTLRLS